MARYRFLGLAILMTALCFMAVAPGEGAMPDRVSFAGLSTPATLKPGKSSDVTLRFVIVPGFHINSSAPKSDLLIPTTLKIDPAGAITAKNIAYAEGKDVAFPFDPDSKLNVYTGEFTVRASLFVPAGTPTGTVPMHGELRYQACSDRSCFPPKTLALDFSVTVEPK